MLSSLLKNIVIRLNLLVPGENKRGFPGDSAIKNLPANAGDIGSIPGLGRSSGEGNGNPLQYSFLGKTEGPGGLHYIGSLRVRHDLATKQQQ